MKRTEAREQAFRLLYSLQLMHEKNIEEQEKIENESDNGPFTSGGPVRILALQQRARLSAANPNRYEGSYYEETKQKTNFFMFPGGFPWIRSPFRLRRRFWQSGLWTG